MPRAVGSGYVEEAGKQLLTLLSRSRDHVTVSGTCKMDLVRLLAELTARGGARRP
jgi:hypothetical protein